MSYRTTERADEDIIAIYVFGEREFGSLQAERYQDGLFRTLDLIGANPQLDRPHEEFDPPVRLHPYGAHLIVYVPSGEGALIIRVLHGRQDWMRRLR